MKIIDLISDEIPALRTSDTGVEALNWMEVFRISHLPIVNNEDYLGLLSEGDIFDLNKPESAIGSIEIKLEKTCVVAEVDDINKVMTIFSEKRLTVLPVTDKKNKYLGTITSFDMFIYLAKLRSFYDIWNFPKELRTAFKQYLDYFSDFLKKTKGIDFNMSILDNEDGLKLVYNTDSQELIDEIKYYLIEYVGFIKQNVDDLKLEINTELTDTQLKILNLEIRNEVFQLRHKLEIKNIENKMLTDQINSIEKLVLNSTNKPQIINISTQSNLQNDQIINIENNINLKVDIPEIQNLISELKDEISRIDTENENKLDNVLDSFDELTPKDNIKKFNKPFNKLFRFLKDLGDEESSINKKISGIKKIKNITMNLFLLYNKFAPVLGLPSL